MRDPVLIGAEDAARAAASLRRSVGELSSQVAFLDEMLGRRLQQFQDVDVMLGQHLENLRAVIENNTQTQLESIQLKLLKIVPSSSYHLSAEEHDSLMSAIDMLGKLLNQPKPA